MRAISRSSSPEAAKAPWAALFLLPAMWFLSALHTFDIGLATSSRPVQMRLGAEEPEAADCRRYRAAAPEERTFLNAGDSVFGGLGILCQDDTENRSYFLQTLFFTGMMAGLGLVSWASERFGRKAAVLGSLALFQVGSAMQTVAPEYMYLAAGAVITGAASAGSLPAFIWCIELFDEPRLHSLIIVLFEGAFILGRITVTLLAMLPMTPSFGWRQLFLLVFMVSSIFWPFFANIPESKQWLAKRRATVDPESAEGARGEAAEPDLIARLRSKELIHAFPIMCLVWFCANLIYYGFALGVPALPVDLYFGNILSALACAPVLLAMPLSDSAWCGRRAGLRGCLLLVAASCLLRIFFTGQTMLMLNWYAGTAGVSLTYALAYLYSAELYPPDIRLHAMALNSFLARSGSLLAPYAAAIGNSSSSVQQSLFCCLALTPVLLLPMLPETREGAAAEESTGLLGALDLRHAYSATATKSNTADCIYCGLEGCCACKR